MTDALFPLPEATETPQARLARLRAERNKLHQEVLEECRKEYDPDFVGELDWWCQCAIKEGGGAWEEPTDTQRRFLWRCRDCAALELQIYQEAMKGK